MNYYIIAHSGLRYFGSHFKSLTISICSMKNADLIKEFELDFLEFLNAKHRDVLDSLKAGKLTDEVIDTLSAVCNDLVKKYKG